MAVGTHSEPAATATPRSKPQLQDASRRAPMTRVSLVMEIGAYAVNSWAS